MVNFLQWYPERLLARTESGNKMDQHFLTKDRGQNPQHAFALCTIPRVDKGLEAHVDKQGLCLSLIPVQLPGLRRNEANF